MKKIALVIHGGASPSYRHLEENRSQYEAGLKDAILAGFARLEAGSTALDAVEYTVMLLEDNPLFNAGCGSALNSLGAVEMDAAIMDGRTRAAGAVSMVQQVKNPIRLARTVLAETPHVMLSGYGALLLAKEYNLPLESEEYFIMPWQRSALKQALMNGYGTVGAVALDMGGNIAAATSTGGVSGSLPGRVGDSCIIGAGCYADNATCAVSGTGIGEYLMRDVAAHTVAMLTAGGMELQVACDTVVHQSDAASNREIGLISLNCHGDIALAFNTEIMKRAYIATGCDLQIAIS